MGLPPCGAIPLADGSVRWTVWAPRAKRVELVLIAGSNRRSIPMAALDRGFFSHTEANTPEGQRYAFRLDGGPERPDPASRWQRDGVHRPSAVVRLDRFPWTDHGWKGIRRQDLVCYELHVGTFTPDGTFAAIIPRLDSLRDLGITAIELMPVGQFPGARDWGYDGVHPFAPQNSYGGPRGLQELVDACHARGLAVFLDVVYNHLGPEGNYLAEFGPYFSNRYRTPWGPAFNYDSAGCDAARAFILDNVRHWIADYHIDGLRIDAVHAIYDMGARHILREIKETADHVAASLGRSALIIAESSLNDVRILLPPKRGGFGLDGQWNDDFHHAVHAYLTGERQGYYADFGDVADFPRLFEQGFLFTGNYSQHRDRRHGAPVGDLPGDRFLVSIQNHDQVGNRARGDRFGTLLEPAAQRLAASLMLLSPHLPLLFMGEEYGETRPFPFFCSFEDPELIENVRRGRREEFAAFAWQGEVPDPQAEATFASARLSWSWPEGSHHAGLRRLYRDLLAARRRWPGLRDFVNRTAKLVPDAAKRPMLLVTRGTGRETLTICFNLAADGLPAVPPPPGAVRLFTSESADYHGARADATPDHLLLPYECIVFGVR